MAKAKPVAAKAPTSTGGTKMVQKHSEFIEPDMAAAMPDADRFAGPNPFPKGSYQASQWDHLKKNTK